MDRYKQRTTLLRLHCLLVLQKFPLKQSFLAEKEASGLVSSPCFQEMLSLYCPRDQDVLGYGTKLQSKMTKKEQCGCNNKFGLFVLVKNKCFISYYKISRLLTNVFTKKNKCPTLFNGVQISSRGDRVGFKMKIWGTGLGS